MVSKEKSSKKLIFYTNFELYRRKLGGLFIIAALRAAYPIDLECIYQDFGNLYVCGLQNITVLDPLENVTFTGTHAPNRTDADVNYVGISNSNTPFIIQQLFTTFPSITGLDIVNSNLQTIQIPPVVQLEELAIFGNNISRIESASLRNQTRLIQLFAMNNGIATIDEDAFEDLSSLLTLIISDNRITELHPRTLSNLTEVVQIYFDRNLITTIDEDTFSQNTNLAFLFFEDNEIDKIHPRTIAKIRNNLNFLNLSGNRCISNSFSTYPEGDLEWMTIHNLLQPCFNNFLGNDPDVRNVTMQLRGPLTIFDSFGNMIARF